MKPLVLRPCVLGPYAPLRASFKRECVANKLCFSSRNHTEIVQIDVGYFQEDLLTPNPIE